MKILNRYDSSVIFEDSSDTIIQTLLSAIKAGANLCGADLSGSNLRGSNLRGADLTGANLYGVNLSGADLSGADLTGANLSGADLYGANLYGANLYGANLRFANLDTTTKINWNAHDLISELVMQFQTDKHDLEKRKIAGLILVSRDWCWNQFSKLESPIKHDLIKHLSQWKGFTENLVNN